MTRGLGKTTRMLHRVLGSEAHQIVVLTTRPADLTYRMLEMAPYLLQYSPTWIEDQSNGRTIWFQRPGQSAEGLQPRPEIHTDPELL